jgi:phage terminase large subunit
MADRGHERGFCESLPNPPSRTFAEFSPAPSQVRRVFACSVTRERIVGLRAWAEQDASGAVVAALAPYRDRLDVVNVDAAGIGYYLAKHLQDVGFPVRPVNVGERSSDPERYANLKAELYWGLRQRFQAGEVAGLTDERAIGQLAGIRYRHTARGQVEIERKEDARKRGVKSPDRAEAVMLAFARPAVTQLLAPHAIVRGL